jgi:2-phosphoglycerate kinase
MTLELSDENRLSLVLVGGPAGVGKSRLAHALARRLASTVAQVDDLQTAIEALVPPERLPEYYVPSTTHLRTDSAEEMATASEEIAAFFAPAVLAAVSNRIESGTSTVFEGDFISPEVAVQARELGARPVFLLGLEEEIRGNLLRRDGEEQRGRARVAALLSERLADRCRALGVPAIGARPFDTLLPRACAALGIASG